MTFFGVSPCFTVVPENTCGAAPVTPSICRATATASSPKGDEPRNGPAAPDGIIQWSTPVSSTVSLASTVNPFASPVRTSVIAKTTPVPTIAMMKRRRRHCRSRKAAMSTVNSPAEVVETVLRARRSRTCRQPSPSATALGNVRCMNGTGHASRSLPLILARELATNLSTPMFLLDAAGTLVFFNEAAERLIGRSFAEMGEIPGLEFGDLLDLARGRRRTDAPPRLARGRRLLRAETGPQAGAVFLLRRRDAATSRPPRIHSFGAADEMHGVVTVFWQRGANDAPTGDAEPS